MQRSSRVDYDAIAPLYDSQPHREKSPDPALAAFLAERSALGTALLLDIACGTGNQLVANRAIASSARMVGFDGSLGMLRQARAKSAEIGWVDGDSSALPFASGTFDFASCQYALHHFRDKPGMVREAFRVLQTGGRLAIFNMCPHDSLDWLYYDYFPEALTRDLADFWPPEAVVAEMTSAGFVDVVVDRDHRRDGRDLAAFLEGLRRRDRNSQLLTLSDQAYEAGLCRLESELADPNAPRSRADHLCLVTIRGDKSLH
jgi:ubiquinone/menaquinone biosynthesis C-methylase UbiE